MNEWRIVNADVLTPSGWVRGGSLEIRDGRIAGVFGPGAGRPDDGVPAFDAGGAMALPGFVDVHVHGGGGYDAMSGEYEQLDGMCRHHAALGTTSLLATTLTASGEEIERALAGAADAMERGTGGAELLGVHLEGPFLNPVRCGAQNPEHLRHPTPEEMLRFIAASRGTIRLMTIAPELPGAEDVIRSARREGIVVSIGHSDADYETVRRAVAWGATHVTHHFNGMSPLHHREPGVAGGGLALDELALELICDGTHVHPDLIRLVFAAKPRDKVVLVTDCVSAGGLPDGDYELGGLPVAKRDGRIYVRLPDGGRGSLAGSGLSTIDALRNAVAFTGRSLEEIVPALTLNPARQIGVDDRKGTLEPGKDADLVLVSRELQVEATIVRGRIVYRSAADAGAGAGAGEGSGR